MNNKHIPPAVGEFAVGERDQLLARIAEQAREIERLRLNIADYNEHERCYQAEIAALKAQPSVVVLPPHCTDRAIPVKYRKGWNCCISEVARLNSSTVSAGDDAERAAFEAFVQREWPGTSIRRRDALPADHERYGEYVNAFVAHAWDSWQARAALSAPSHGEQVRQMVPSWNLAADELPASGKTVLAFYLNSHGMGRRIRAMHVKRFTVEAEEFADPDTQCCEYSEQDDCYYTTEGWYELIDNWPDYSSCAVIEGVVTHWMPLPAAPSAGSQGGDV